MTYAHSDVSQKTPWEQIFAFVPGRSRNHLEIGSQDYGGWVWGEKPFRYLIASLSDGAGSSLFARESAQLVTNVSLRVLEKFIKNRRFPKEEKARTSVTKKLGLLLVDEIQTALHQSSLEKGGTMSDFSATLISAVIIPQGLFIFQIGDSFCVFRNQGRGDYQLALPLQRGDFVNETNFISQVHAEKLLTIYTQGVIPEFILLATDGLEPVSLYPPDFTPFAPFFSSLESFLKEPSSLKKKEKELRDFLTSDRMNQRTSDDRALFMAYFPCVSSLFPFPELSVCKKRRGS